jgi:hypothetical protein
MIIKWRPTPNSVFREKRGAKIMSAFANCLFDSDHVRLFVESANPWKLQIECDRAGNTSYPRLSCADLTPVNILIRQGWMRGMAISILATTSRSANNPMDDTVILELRRDNLTIAGATFTRREFSGCATDCIVDCICEWKYAHVSPSTFHRTYAVAVHPTPNQIEMSDLD